MALSDSNFNASRYLYAVSTRSGLLFGLRISLLVLYSTRTRNAKIQILRKGN